MMMMRSKRPAVMVVFNALCGDRRDPRHDPRQRPE